MVVVDQTPNHWAGYFRMAHVAGLTLDTQSFEQYLMRAIQHGFELESVISDPDWERFARHSALRPVLRKIIVLYGNEALREWIGEGA